MIALWLLTGIICNPPDKVYGGASSGTGGNWEDDAIGRWLDAVYEAREAAREAEPTENAIEEVAEARHAVTFVNAPVDLTDLAVKLGALENALSLAETQLAIDRKRQAIEIEVSRILEAHAAHEAMEAREKTRRQKELQDEEEMIVLMLFAS